MTKMTMLETAVSLIEPFIQEQNEPEPQRLDVWLDAADLPAAVRALHEAEWGYLAAITGLDLGTEAGHFEVLYHFCEGAAVLGLRVKVVREPAAGRPTVPTVCDIIPSASFFERELSEMFGITVAGTPDPTRLFLPDDWPAGVYPLRKTYQPNDAANDGDN